MLEDPARQSFGSNGIAALPPQTGLRGDSIDDETEFAALRAELAEVVAQLQAVVADRAGRAAAAAAQGTERALEGLRDGVRSNPMLAVGIAVVIGAAIAVVFVPRGMLTGRSPVVRPGDWSLENLSNRASTTQAEIERLARSAYAQVPRASSLLPSFERMIDSLASLDSNGSLAPAIQKGVHWLSSLRANLASAVMGR